MQWSTAILVTAPHEDGFCQSSAVTIEQEFARFGVSIVLTVNIINENQTIDDYILDSIRRVGRSEYYTIIFLKPLTDIGLLAYSYARSRVTTVA